MSNQKNRDYISNKFNNEVIVMEFKSKLFAIMIIFCVIFSVCAVSAADGDDVMGFNDTHDDIGDDYPYDDVEVDESGMNDLFDGTQRSLNMTDSPNLNDTAQNQTAVNTTNAPAHAAGSNVLNTTNATNATAIHSLPATGNPLIALLAVCAVLGGASLYRKK